MMCFHYAMTLTLLYNMAHMTSSDHEVTPKCQSDVDICEFSLTVQSTLSMMSSVSNDVTDIRRPLLIFPNGSRAIRMREGCDDVMFVNKSDSNSAITLDGTYKRIITVNNQMPGPAIVVYEGQQVVVNVTNDLLGESLTLHWHGQHQMGTPWMDGAGGVSHCPINHGETFTYRFIAHPTGTFWYHSHEGVQRSEGVYGAFIVLPRPDSVQHKAQKNYPNFSGDYYMAIQDFYHQTSLEVYHQWAYDLGRFSTGYDDLTSCYEGRENVDGYQNSYIKPQSVLVNGKGWHYDVNSTVPKNPGLPLQTFHVSKNLFYRFRVINAGLALTLKVSIDSHVLNVMATDGHAVRSRGVESIIIAPGERYDFWIKATDPDKTGSYSIRVEGTEWTMKSGDNKYERVLPIHGEAVLQYGHSGVVENSPRVPSSHRRECTKAQPCTLLNCPYQLYPPDQHIVCLPVTSLEPTIPESPLRSRDGDVIEKFFHLHYAGSAPPFYQRISSINSKQFQPPSAPPQIYPPGPWASRHGLMDFDDVCHQEVCPCTHVLRVPTGKIVQLVLMVMAHKVDAQPSSHPVHLHGHSFQVIRIGYPTYDHDTAHVSKQTTDTVCHDGEKTCSHPAWSNSSWSGGNIPGMGANVVRKDTVAVPVGGYVVIRFETTNPGYWFLHCHMEFHNAQGMALIIQEGDVTEMPGTPPNFNTCGDFSWTAKEFRKNTNVDSNKDSFIADQKSLKKYHLIQNSALDVSSEALQLALGLTFSLLIISVLLCVVLLVKLRKARTGYTRVSSSESGATSTETSFTSTNLN